MKKKVLSIVMAGIIAATGVFAGVGEGVYAGENVPTNSGEETIIYDADWYFSHEEKTGIDSNGNGEIDAMTSDERSKFEEWNRTNPFEEGSIEHLLESELPEGVSLSEAAYYFISGKYNYYDLEKYTCGGYTLKDFVNTSHDLCYDDAHHAYWEPSEPNHGTEQFLYYEYQSSLSPYIPDGKTYVDIVNECIEKEMTLRECFEYLIVMVNDSEYLPNYLSPYTVKLKLPDRKYGYYYTYNGKARKPAVTVYKGNKKIAKKNYTVTYKKNKNAGWAEVIIKGKTKQFNKTINNKKMLTQFQIRGKTVPTELKQKKYVVNLGCEPFNIGATCDLELTYRSNNKNVATVDENGVVTIVGKGEAHINIVSVSTRNYWGSSKSVKIVVE